MSINIGRRHIYAESLSTVSETCPRVDRAFEECLEAVKVETTALRKGMEDWIERALEAEATIAELEERIKELEEQLEAA